MNKIVEEMIIALVKRVEKIEHKLSHVPVPNKQGFFPTSKTKPGMASAAQLKLLRNLGAECLENMTKGQAGIEIDRLLKKPKKKEKPDMLEKSDTLEKDPYEIENKPLTKKQIAELEAMGKKKDGEDAEVFL